ncbi:UDP-N-acetyl-D-mannosamine dehydrogenase [Limnospira sp. PMC 917.15]|uniref:UDP-N-acetyl-D-mannosamine dehydrogenase n=1 Tax=Limnospira sp. PMC 917.15 TaxID=2981106 RepID=UPI0028E136F7|nr:UDP-N-acetyl-D-mannosamine dehydrogenase [Limnospira sp. PMC 917.15]MDT9234065.1 UDP-N-acetyl-D-mannosamine dehydrogenase [Limnospira sp. PMC 917.15]
MKTVCVMGLGYVGLPTASLLANRGFKVHGVDINPSVVELISQGEVHITEPDLDICVKEAVNSGNLTVGKEPKSADVFIVAVPTPFKDGHVPDISYIEAATKALAPYVESGNLVILESTSPVGTTEKMAGWLQELRPELDVEGSVYMAHCPERVLPGQTLKELVVNDRVIGGLNSVSADKAAQFYRQFVTGEIVCTNARTAELAKLAENSFRDVNIAFANELSMICDRLDINVWELIQLANRHPRVNILQPGPGVGGHCIAVDPWFIVDAAPQEARLIRTAREVNDSKIDFVVDKVKEAAKKFKNPKIACLGLSYKADIDDLRESPAINVVKTLLTEKIGDILVVEPHIKALPNSFSLSKNLYFLDLEIALQQADILVFLVKHKAFNHINLSLFKKKFVIIDIVH